MFKTFIKVFTGLVVLLVITVAVFLYTFDANRYKAEIISLAESASGRTISIDGDMDISLYPWIGIEINDVSVGNTDGFSNQVFAAVGQFDVRIKIMPLLKKRLEIDRVVLHRLELDFEQNAAGENNWTDIVTRTTGDDAQSGFELAGIAIGAIDLADSRISWNNTETGKQFKLSKLSMSTQALSKGQALPLEMKAFVESNQPKWMAAVHAKTTLNFDENETVIDANGLKLNAKALLPDSDLGKLNIVMLADGRIDLQKQSAKLSKAKIGALGLVMAGNFDVENLFGVPQIQGAFKLKPFDMRKLAQKLEFGMPQLANENSLGKVALEASLKTDFSSIRIDNITAAVDESRLQGFMQIKAADRPVMHFELKADQLNLDNYLLAGDEHAPLPLGLIRKIDFEGVLDVETAMLAGVELTELHVAASSDNGIFVASPITTRLIEGEVKAMLRLDSGDVPALLFTADVAQVDADSSINPMLAGMIGERAPTLQGRVDANIDLSASGASMSALKSSASGLVKVDMGKAVLRGVDFKYVSQAVVVDYAERNDFRVSRTFNDEMVADSETEFNSLSATFKLSNGKLINKDLAMASELVNVNGAGMIDVHNATLDYRPVIDMNMKSTVNVRDKLRDHPMEYHAHGEFGALTTDFESDKYDLWVGRLMLQEAKANRNRRLNSKSESSWNNALSK